MWRRLRRSAESTGLSSAEGLCTCVRSSRLERLIYGLLGGDPIFLSRCIMLMFFRLFLSFFGATLVLGQTDPLSLDDAIRLAWANDPTVAALTLTPELARARETQAGLRPNPERDVRRTVPAASDSEWSVGVGLTQRFPRRERVELARAYALLGGEAAAWELRERRRLLAAEVRRLWYDQAVQHARLSSAQRTLTLQQELVGFLQGRRAAGEVADAEWELFQIELARAEHTVVLAQAEVAGGEGALRRRLRLVTNASLSLAGQLDRLVDREVPAEGDLSSTRPELALADLEVRRAEAALALARGESRGDWSVGAGVDFERRSNDATGRLESQPRLGVSASVPWPGERVANRGDILERAALLKIAEATREARRDELLIELGSALAAVRTAQPAVQRYRALLASASELPRKLGPAYARGEVTGFQLAQARLQHVTIEAEFLAAAARYLANLADAESAAGLVPAQP